MVVYTPLVKHREGGRAAIEALIDLFVAETNQAYANSGGSPDQIGVEGRGGLHRGWGLLNRP